MDIASQQFRHALSCRFLFWFLFCFFPSLQLFTLQIDTEDHQIYEHDKCNYAAMKNTFINSKHTLVLGCIPVFLNQGV